MGDEDDGDAPIRQFTQGVQQDPRLCFRQHRRRLVQHQQPRGGAVDLAGDFHELLVTHGHFRGYGVDADIDAQGFDGLCRADVHGGAVQGRDAFAENLFQRGAVQLFPVEQDVLGGGEPGDERKFLVDHPHPRLQGVEWGFELRFLPVDENRPFITSGAGDDRHPEKNVH